MEYGGQMYVCPSHLPPLDAWKVDPKTAEKITVPTDDRGFVLLDETVDELLGYFEDDYPWVVDGRFQQTKPDIHHFHWFKEYYEPRHFNGSQIPRLFRNVPSRLGLVPRQFHNVAHFLTLPPEVPQLADMERHVTSYRVARDLFEAAIIASDTKRRFRSVNDSDDEIAKEMLISRFKRQFGGLRQHIETLGELDADELLEIDMPRIEKSNPAGIVRLLGKAAIKRPIDYTNRFVTAQAELVAA